MTKDSTFLTEADKKFICRALGMHAAITTGHIKDYRRMTDVIWSWAGLDGSPLSALQAPNPLQRQQKRHSADSQNPPKA